MLPKDKDSIANTFFVATAVCLVCSLLVSTAAVVTEDSMQDRNVELDRKKKHSCRWPDFTPEEIKQTGVEELFPKRFESQLIDLDTGEVATAEDWRRL